MAPPSIMDRDSLLEELQNHLGTAGRQMDAFHFHDKFLSPVRNQRDGGQCAFVATITCMEMLHRIFRIKISNWPDRYFFNIDDVFNSFYDVYSNLPRAQEKKANKHGMHGTRVNYILEFIKEHGLKLSSECYDPLPRDYLADFDRKAKRHKIEAYRKLNLDDVVRYLKSFPVIGVIRRCESFKDCKTVLYDGPSDMEREKLKDSEKAHCLVVVGTAMIELQSRLERYFILQDSHGESFGFKGFYVARFDPVMFVEFWIPLKWVKPQPNVSNKRKRADYSKDDMGDSSLHA